MANDPAARGLDWTSASAPTRSSTSLIEGAAALPLPRAQRLTEPPDPPTTIRRSRLFEWDGMRAQMGFLDARETLPRTRRYATG